MAAKMERKVKVVADNRKARFNYEIGEVFEAGIMLTGTEVKSLCMGKATIAESYADSRGGEIWLINSNIPEYLQASRFNHEPKRRRKLLLHKKQVNKLAGAVEREGMTLVPLRLYFNERGRAKVELALARGKKLHDKRETLKKRSWDRERGRLELRLLRRFVRLERVVVVPLLVQPLLLLGQLLQRLVLLRVDLPELRVERLLVVPELDLLPDLPRGA